MTLNSSPPVSSAEFFDGKTALSRPVTVQLLSGNLVMYALKTDVEISRWGLTDIHWVGGTDKPVLTSSVSPDARLILEQQDFATHLLTLVPNLRKAVATTKSGKTHKMAWTYGALAVALTIGVFVAVPWLSGPLAGLVSDEWREDVGSQTATQIETLLGKTCTGPAGQIVLDKLTKRLASQLPVPEKLNVAVIDNKMINAFALPGGYIRFIGGLITAADGPDEVAGVLAHEMAHVALRHAEEQTFRQMGYRIVLSTFADSGTITELAGSAGVHLINASHSREAESAADALAIQMLEQADISRGGMVSFFERVEKMEGKTSDLFKYLSTHPATGKRKEIAAASTGGSNPSMSDEEWQALKNICD